jgi:site-specific recombinase XerD
VDWDEALREFDRDLKARGAAERTRSAYAVDLGQLAEWASDRGRGPTELRHRDVRRYAAGLSAARAAPTTVWRNLAPLRTH